MSNFLNNTTDLEKILDILNNGKYVDTADATATANDIKSGKTAYVNGENIEGTLQISTYYTGTEQPSSDLGSNDDIYIQISEENTTVTSIFYPQAYDTSDYKFSSIVDATNPIGKSTSNTTYAKINTYASSGVESYVYWPFDLSAIPSNATIESVSCEVKVMINMTLKSYSLQLYSGNTPKGSASTSGGVNAASIYTLNVGTWTRNELSNCRFRMGLTNSGNYTLQNGFYGADLTVTYTYQKKNSQIYKKIDGNWVKQNDISDVIDTTTNLVKGE